MLKRCMLVSGWPDLLCVETREPPMCDDEYRCPYCDRVLSPYERGLWHACGPMQSREICERVRAREQREGLAQRRSGR